MRKTSLSILYFFVKRKKVNVTQKIILYGLMQEENNFIDLASNQKYIYLHTLHIFYLSLGVLNYRCILYI